MATELGLPAGATPAFPALYLNDAELADAFVEAHRQCEASPDPLAREALVVGVLMTLLGRHAVGASQRDARAPPGDALRRVVEFIKDCHAGRLTLDGLARAGGMSRYGLLRAFRRHMRISPYAFVTQVRVDRARKLLAAGMGIASVSQRVGFADQSHLNRHFKRLMGVTPGAYVRGVRPA